jgi:hypothetical protein
MIEKSETRKIMRAAFEDVALTLGGLAAVYELDDAFIEKFIKGLEAAKTTAFKRIERAGLNHEELFTSPDITPHPVIEEFLRNIRRG